MKKIVVFTGAGMSADSGLATFRDSDGLWADYRIEDVCTPEALARDRAAVVGFYNMRRREMLAASPNAGHRAIAELECAYDADGRIFDAFGVTYVSFGVLTDAKNRALWMGNTLRITPDFIEQTVQ